MTRGEPAKTLNPAELAIVMAATIAQADGRVHAAAKEALERMIEPFRAIDPQLVRAAKTNVVVEFPLTMGEFAKEHLLQFIRSRTQDLAVALKRQTLTWTLAIAAINGKVDEDEAMTSSVLVVGMGLTKAELRASLQTRTTKKPRNETTMVEPDFARKGFGHHRSRQIAKRLPQKEPTKACRFASFT